MLDLYTNPDRKLQPYIAKAHRIRAVTFKLLMRRLARALVPAAMRHRLSCRRARKRAIRELRALSDLQLKDIGIGRSEILFQAAAAQPAGCRG